MTVPNPERGTALVMPMAGRGSRFARAGEDRPKPLVEFCERPFFWWACESVRRVVPVERLVFVVLAEHCRDHAIDRRILSLYPSAEIVAIDGVTSGAAETAMRGVELLHPDMAVAINDCDHAFRAPALGAALEALQAGRAAGALLTFRSDSPAFSYVRLSGDGAVIGTVEKRVVSPHAIAGCYWFARAGRLGGLYETYLQRCSYAELFVSGLYDLICAEGDPVARVEVERHVSFGTPEELARIEPDRFRADFPWTTP
jgi:NDP-sugar pyrophosphorylase family protein